MAGMSTRFHLFETAFGWIGIGWTDKGICRIQLPERDRASTERRLRRTLPYAEESPPTPVIGGAIEAIGRYFSGETVDFSGLPLDLPAGDAFRLAIWQAARNLGHGETTTYGALAVQAGHGGMARETGEALGRNPVPIIVPCHRILAAGGKLGGFSAPGGAATKERLLVLEHALPQPAPVRQASFAF